MTSEIIPLPGRDVLEHVVDVHCHPTDEIDVSDEVMSGLSIKLCAMASHFEDQKRVADLARRYPDKEEHYRTLFLSNPSVKKEEALSSLLPTLPEPRSLRSMMEELRSNLLAHPTAMLGEVGIDRSFRIAEPPYPSPAPRKLTPFVTPITHQLEILEAQLDLAVELKRNVSMHSVASQQATMDLLKKMEKKHDAAWRMISIDMHSCGFSLESWKDIEKTMSNIFLSLSTVINSRSDNHVKLIKNCSEDRLLSESDYNEARHCTLQTWQIIETIGRLRGWPLETKWEPEEPPKDQWGVVRRLERNWERFVSGNHPEIPPHKSRKLRKQHENYPSDESEED